MKILDFGLAKVISASPAEATSAPTAVSKTSVGVVLGTAGYMAPEQVRGAASDHRCDLFSLGAVLYEMLSGRRAFGGSSSADSMSAILEDEPPDLPASVPAALAAIIRRCEKIPDERFQTARDLTFALETVSSASGSEKSVAVPRSPRFSRRRIAGCGIAEREAAAESRSSPYHAISSTRPIAPVKRAHVSVSTSSCLRPAAVSW